jgi:hypothetical protein
MNILPKKRWHVRTKENIARVRKDEKEAEDQIREVERRSKLAEQEARTRMLRERARARTGLEPPEAAEIEANAAPVVASKSGGHVNFFEDLEAGETTHKDNQEREAEKKAEQDEYEKKIGLLVLLGQGRNSPNSSKGFSNVSRYVSKSRV